MNKLNLISLLFILSIGFSCSPVFTKNDLENASAHYKIGTAFLNENKIQHAFIEFQKAYELNPKDKEVLNAIGIIYLLHFDDIPKAIDHFEKSIKVDPDYSEANNNLGFAYEKLGNYKLAISFYEKAISNLLYPTPEKAYLNMGNSYYRLGKYDLAINSFKQAINRAPDLYLPYFGLALCYNAMNRYGDASTAITKAIELHPVYKGDIEKAIDDLNLKRLSATGKEAQDIEDYLDIINY